jgi:hypothetical protein
MHDRLAKDGAAKRKHQGACQITLTPRSDGHPATLLDFKRKIAKSNRIEIRRPD